MTVIKFNEKGRPYWVKIKTQEYQIQHYRVECNYTKQDKEWFRKPLCAQ